MGIFFAMRGLRVANRTGNSSRLAAAWVHCGVMIVAMSLGAPGTVRAAGTDLSGGHWYDNFSSCVPAPSGSLVYAGACSPSSSVVNEHVTVADGSGGAANNVLGGYSINGQATGNVVTMTGGTADVLAGGLSNNDDATGNTVTVSGGKVNQGVYGGASDFGDAADNTVIISGGLVNSLLVVGGMSSAGAGTTSGNTITISGGSLHATGVVSGYNTGTGAATDNTVTISGGTVAGTASNSPVLIAAGAGYNAVTNNRLILAGSPTLTGAILYGGFAMGSVAPVGNVLEMRTTGITTKNLHAFQELDFLLPATTKVGATVLTLTGDAANTSGGTVDTDLRGVKVGVALQDGNGHALQKGDRVTLVHNANGVQTDPTINQASMTGYQGIALDYSFGLSADADNLFATVTSAPQVANQTKAPVEARASMMTLLQRGVDLADSAGIANAQARTSDTQPGAFFGAMSGGHARYDTGSHTNVDGMGVVLGLARRFAQASGPLLAGAYVQGSVGSYNTYNDFDGGQTVHGDGNSHAAGVGALLRKDWARKDGGGPYLTGGVQLGRVQSKWTSDDMQGSPQVSYNTSSNYYGARVGAGYVKPLTRLTNVDVSAQYYYTHMTGDDATLAGNDFDFSAVNSSRARLGARLNHTFGNQVVGYVGAIFERQFDGTARATVLDMATPSPTLEGNTRILELGFHTKPTADSPMTVDFAVQAYSGVREGVSGTVNLDWLF